MEAALQRWVRRAAVDWRVGTFVNTLLICGMIVAGSFGYAKIQTERKERIGQFERGDKRSDANDARMCRVLLPTQDLYRFVGGRFARDPDFRMKLDDAAEAFDELPCRPPK